MQICKCLGTTAPENIITAVCSCRRNITPTKAEFNTVVWAIQISQTALPSEM